MSKEKISGRQLKKIILQLLQVADFEKGLEEIRRLPPRQAVNPLISFLCSLDEEIKWRAVTALGRVVSELAAFDLESARIVMRRFIWNLNDESGGIGWGCPEAMGAAMAENEKLAGEYGCILISYIQPQGNYLEHEGLQRGVLWGVGRLAYARPHLVRAAVPFLLPYMESNDPHLRGLAVWAAGPLANAEMLPRIKQLSDDPARLNLYRDGHSAPYSVGHLAREVLASIEQKIDA
jgi:hypothetical protein